MSEEDELWGLLIDGRLEEAISCALSFDDRRKAAQILNDFAVSLREENIYQDMELALKAAVKIDPYFPEAYYNLGLLLSEPEVLEKNKEKIAEAEAAFKKALELKADLLDARLNLGLLYTFTDRLEKAEKEVAVLEKYNFENTQSLDALKKIISAKKADSS